jgi:hypothetical protein
MVATTRFRLSQHEVGGYLIVVIGVTSLERVSHMLQEQAS